MGFGTGVQILIGWRNGQKQYKRTGMILENGFYFLGVVVLIIIVFVFLFAETILTGLLSSQDIIQGATSFLKIRVFTLFFSFGSVLMRSFFVGITVTKYIGRAALVVALTNVVLDYLLIFGYYGFPEMGLNGAALASVLCEVAGMVYFLIVVFKQVDREKYNLFKFSRPVIPLINQTLNLSVYTMFQTFISLSAWFLFFVIVEKSGKDNLAATNILRSIYVMLMLPVWTFNAAVSTLVSNAIGEQRSRFVMHIIRRVIMMSLCLVLIISIPCVLFPRQLMMIYTSNQVLVDIGYKAVFTIVIANIFNAFCSIYFSAVSATGNTRMALWMEIICITIYLLWVKYFVTAYPTRLEFMWSSEIVYFILIGILSAAYMYSNRWKGQLK